MFHTPLIHSPIGPALLGLEPIVALVLPFLKYFFTITIVEIYKSTKTTKKQLIRHIKINYFSMMIFPIMYIIPH